MTKNKSERTKKNVIGTYQMDVISLPEECDFEDNIPIEIVYIFRKYPEYKKRFRRILSEGKAIGVRTILRTPENILKAVHTISVHSQENFIITWLPKLLRDKHLPVITESDSLRAASFGENIEDAVQLLIKNRLRFKYLVLIDEENLGITPEEREFIANLNELIYPLQIDYAVFRVIDDNAHERTAVAQTIIKALFIVGPVAHILEKFAAGIGKVFAASADDLLGEAAELTALRGSGFSWGVLWRRSYILIPVFAIATYGAFSVEHLLETGHVVAGGMIFGASAVALSLTTAVQSFFMYLKNLKKLKIQNKLSLDVIDQGLITLTIRQDFTNPARFGLLLGAMMAPFMGIIGSILGLMHNGWVLAAIGSTESIVAGITVISAGYLNNFRFQRVLRRLTYGHHSKI